MLLGIVCHNFAPKHIMLLVGNLSNFSIWVQQSSWVKSEVPVASTMVGPSIDIFWGEELFRTWAHGIHAYSNKARLLNILKSAIVQTVFAVWSKSIRWCLRHSSFVSLLESWPVLYPWKFHLVFFVHQRTIYLVLDIKSLICIEPFTKTPWGALNSSSHWVALFVLNKFRHLSQLRVSSLLLWDFLFKALNCSLMPIAGIAQESVWWRLRLHRHVSRHAHSRHSFPHWRHSNRLDIVDLLGWWERFSCLARTFVL